MRAPKKIYPIILAAGKSSWLGFPKALARFGEKTALQIALDNCAQAGLQTPVVVLGHAARKLRAAVPRGIRVVMNRQWQTGQLSSLLAGLRHVPRGAPFMVYPVDLPLLTAALLRKLVHGFNGRLPRHTIVAPLDARGMGHPVIFSAEMRHELAKARTAKDVVYLDKRRIKLVPVRTPAIRQDFSTPTSYRRCRSEYLRQQAAL